MLHRNPIIQMHEFLGETYSSLRDTPIQSWDQGEYEERETPLLLK